MPIREQASTEPTLITSAPVGQVRGGRPRYKGGDYFFEYWIDPQSIQILDGRAYYRPIRVNFIPGLQGMRNESDYESVRAYHRGLGRIQVPDDHPALAWGKRLKGYRLRLDNGQDMRGKQLWHYTEVWRQYETVGSSTVSQWDADGWLAFMASLEKVVGSPPNAAVIRHEAAKQRKIVGKLRRTTNPGALLEATRIESTLTPSEDSTED